MNLLDDRREAEEALRPVGEEALSMVRRRYLESQVRSWERRRGTGLWPRRGERLRTLGAVLALAAFGLWSTWLVYFALH